MTEGVEHGDEHRHRQRHRDDERNGEAEHFDDDAPRQSLADQIAKLLGDLIDEHRARERGDRVSEWREVLPQDVTAEDAHGRSRHYIRNPKSLQGMRLHAQLVLLAATLVVPQVHAQAPVYTFGVPPLVAPRNPALAPGGRLGSRVPPALLAHAWAAGVLARRLPLFGPQNVSAAVTATPSPVNAPGGVPSVGVAAGEHRGVFGQYADLAMQLNLRFELKADQFRNLRCTSQERQLAISGCSAGFPTISPNPRSEEHTSELQSLAYLVCRLLLEKKKTRISSAMPERTTWRPVCLRWRRIRSMFANYILYPVVYRASAVFSLRTRKCSGSVTRAF